MNTPFVQLYFTLHHSGAKLHPNELFTIRQLFPAAFRRAAGCLTAAQLCGAGSDCPCRAVFEQKLTPDLSALRRYQKPPFPFAFKMPPLSANCRQGETVELSLLIAGEAISQLDLFIRGVMLLFAAPGSLKNWRTGAVEAAAADGSRIAIPAGVSCADFASLPLLSFDELFTQGGGDCAGISVKFLTPVRLLHKGVPLRDIPFSAVAGALLRRISSLAYYYGKEELPYDFKWLAEKSRAISCRRSGLQWVNHGGGLQGIEGEVQFSGELTEFIPFLTLGSRLNIGKGAPYGMGSYRFSVE